jgi:CMP-N-acetylneuraminic acid synthetase
VIGGKRVLGVTLARGGSKSVYKKNIRPLAGRPLIAYTIEEALASSYLDDYIVSTDDDEIAQVSRGLGASVPFVRPRDLATDTATSGDAVAHAVDFMEEQAGQRYDYVIELMCTNPLKTRGQIDEALETLERTGGDTVIAVSRVLDQHPARIKQIVDGQLVNFCIPEPLEMRRQDLMPEAYIRIGSIYAMTRDYILETHTRYGSEASYALVVPEGESINVDNEIDFAVAEILMARRSR